MSLRNAWGSEVVCYGCGKFYDAYPEDDWTTGGQRNTAEHQEHVNGKLAEAQEERDDWLRTAYGVEG